MTTAARVSSCATFALALIGAAPALAQTSLIAPAACDVAALQARVPAGTTITAAQIVDAKDTQPRFCQVDGHVATPGNTVNFRLGLPDAWNGKFYFGGVGGLAGTLGSLTAGLARGYATASTDTGHDRDDVAWMSDAAKVLDYGHRGTHVTAVASKALTAAFYGKAPAHAYFNGCSNGGRQALMEVQRYPTDFDGIIAGDPATGTPMQVARVLVFQKLLASPETYIPQAKIEMLSAATLAACDGVDGLKDGLVSAPDRCTFKPDTLKCSGADGPSCLTPAQLDIVKMVYGGLTLAGGEQYAYGFPLGHEGGRTGWQGWLIGVEPPTRQEDGTLDFRKQPPSGFTLSSANMRMLQPDPSFDWRDFRLDRDLSRMEGLTDMLSPLDADLRPFKRAGGKIILYHGLADPAISANGTIEYYKKMSGFVGGAREAESFARLYLAPGMHHCNGGPGPNEFDMLTALEQWVEQGRAPGAIVATHKTDGKVDRTRPLCPYPQQARYVGSGSIDEAASFRCELR